MKHFTQHEGLGDSTLDFVGSLSGIGQAWHIRWFGAWHDELDEVLREPLDFGGYPPELWRLLAHNRGQTPKKTVLITDHDMPVALAVLRHRGHHWEPATQYVLPGVVMPARTGCLLSALTRLDVDLEVAWWRMSAPPPAHPWIRQCAPTSTHRLRLTDDIEQFWRNSGKMKDIRLARNRCQSLNFTVDAPGAAEWIIRKWAEKWSHGGTALMEEVDDRVVAANFLAAHGLHHALLLCDGDKPVAGATLTIHGKNVVAGVIYRDPEYDRLNVNTRLIDWSFQWALEAGYATYDIGGGHEYKHQWAPCEGERWQLRICPPLLFDVEQLLLEAKRLGHTVTATLEHTVSEALEHAKVKRDA